jgi:DNA-binding NarL/FixJ family response regulator
LPVFAPSSAPSAAAIRVLVVDDHVFLRDGIRAIIQSQTDLAVVGEAEDGEQAVAQFQALRPDVVLMDLQMPRMGGVEAIEAIMALDGDARILVLTTYAGDAQALRALKAGAAGYLLKSALRQELLDTIRSVRRGGRHVDAQVATGIAIHIVQDALTEREIRVLSLAASGHSNRQIAQKVVVAEETVKGYMKAIFSKLGARDRTHAVTLAAKRGIIEIYRQPSCGLSATGCSEQAIVPARISAPASSSGGTSPPWVTIQAPSAAPSRMASTLAMRRPALGLSHPPALNRRRGR